MRRGHPPINVWQNENTRNFRPGGGNAPHFRSQRPFSVIDVQRYPPGPRAQRAPHTFNQRLEDRDNNRDKFRHGSRNSHSRSVDRRHHNQGHNYGSHNSRHNHVQKMPEIFQNKKTEGYVNYMGDVDHRQQYYESKELQRSIPVWSNSPNKEHKFDGRNYYQRHFRQTDLEKQPIKEYSGHRPTLPDQYGTPIAAIDSSNSFSRTVDDTVDIVRRRLMNRNDPHVVEGQQSESEPVQINNNRESVTDSCPNLQTDQLLRKKRHRQSDKVSCNKMKNKIVNQLFKMDKDKMHKLMDNPNSSTKFEYAISSLIKESQNSFHQHMRSVAEKSLCTSSEFINNGNNTIYEDTFMKEMQCILDPQDTVLLEDIKPLVLAELNKVLQLDEFDQNIETEDQDLYQSKEEYQQGDPFGSDYYEEYQKPETSYYNDIEQNAYNDESETIDDFDYYHKTLKQEEPQFIFERQFAKNDMENVGFRSDDRKHRKSTDTMNAEQSTLEESRMVKDDKSIEEMRRTSSESRRLSTKSNKSIDGCLAQSTSTLPLFDPNCEQLSGGEEDPFADLDNQYHVAVDPNFIASDDLKFQQETNKSKTPTPSLNEFSNKLKSKEINVKNEIDSQLLTFAQTPFTLNVQNQNSTEGIIRHDSLIEKVDNLSNQRSNNTVENTIDRKEEKVEHSKDSKDQNKSEEVRDNSKTVQILSNSRKRSIDQKPSHRKEKRKKCENTLLESSKKILNKNIIINVTDCSSKPSQNKTAKSIFNLYFSKEDNSKESKDMKKSVDSQDKVYSDKYVKRKATAKKKDNSNATQSMTSPKDSQASKSDCKTKLQTIDMFLEQPRKVNIHQAHRNTAPLPSPTKIGVESQKPQAPKLNKKHVSTQVNRKYCIKETQTIPKRLIMRSSQTDPIPFESTDLKAADPLERMKQIDLEIQLLLQEKFKLYNSIEIKGPSNEEMQDLGMQVLDVHLEDEQTPSDVVEISDEVILVEIDSKTSEELERNNVQTLKAKPKCTNNIEVEKTSESPTTMLKRSSRQRTKFPNVSLLQKIIDDEMPLEEIIPVNEFQKTTRKGKKGKPRPQKIKQSKKLNKNIRFTNLMQYYDIKECSVVIPRLEFNNYIVNDISNEVNSLEKEDLFSNIDNPAFVTLSEDTNDEATVAKLETIETIVEEEIVDNDLHFDMLDVSEDIVIGDSCDKYSVEKDDVIHGGDIITEEIILDNSQSSSDEAMPDARNESPCRLYDFAADENLKKESKLVTGNADAVLAIECVENNFLAASLDGNVYYFSGDGQLLTTLRGSNLAVTCLTIVKEKYGTTIYTGSLDSRIRYYDLETGMEKGPECNVLSPIQTMDLAWDTVFVGTRTGFVLQFECKNNMLIPVSTVKFSEQSILALRAMKEGPRKVLLVAARSENVTIKDAQTGLLLRTLVGPKMTVYTLLYEDGKVYCGTSNHQIHVFDYTSGLHAGTHSGGKGAVCLRAAGGLVFAGCYDGCVYVFRDNEPQPCAQLVGPAPMLLSLAVLGTKIIAGYKDRSLHIWKIPLNLLKEMVL